MKSSTLPIYTRWLPTATADEIAFVDSVYALCEERYSDGGDTIVECYEPAEVLKEFKTLDEVRDLCGLLVEHATNYRWGEDSDPEIARLERFEENWAESPHEVDDIPDWARPMSSTELEREAMDYEFNASYDRYDGYREDAKWLGDDYDDDPEPVDPSPTVNFVSLPDDPNNVLLVPWYFMGPMKPTPDDEIPF